MSFEWRYKSTCFELEQKFETKSYLIKVQGPLPSATDFKVPIVYFYVSVCAR